MNNCIYEEKKRIANTKMASSDDLSGPALVGNTWPDEITLEANTLMTLATPFKSASQSSRYLVIIDGVAQSPNGVTNMDIKLNGTSIVPTRPLRTNEAGSAALSMSSIVVCSGGTMNGDLCDNNITIEFLWQQDDSAPGTVTAPQISSVNLSMLSVVDATQSTPTDPGDDEQPVLQL